MKILKLSKGWSFGMHFAVSVNLLWNVWTSNRFLSLYGQKFNLFFRHIFLIKSRKKADRFLHTQKRLKMTFNWKRQPKDFYVLFAMSFSGPFSFSDFCTSYKFQDSFPTVDGTYWLDAMACHEQIPLNPLQKCRSVLVISCRRRKKWPKCTIPRYLYHIS